MLLRLRSRDGLERVEVPDGATVGDLKQEIWVKLGVPLSDLRLSRQPGLLTSKTPETFADLAADGASLSSLGLAHGDIVFMWYSGERDVQPAFKRSVLDTRPFGARITVQDIASRIVKIERQDKAVVESISFDGEAANQFQQYVRGVLGFRIKRAGLLYGTVTDDNCIKVDFIYEPPQDGTPMDVTLQRGTDEEAQVDFLAGLLGLKKVGLIFSQSDQEREFILHTGELIQAASIQGELGEASMTVVVSWDKDAGDPGGHVHFEAFQCSKQCVQLVKDGWLQAPAAGEPPTGITSLRNPKDPADKTPVMVAGKDAGEIDNDYFLVPARITQHTSTLLNTGFPVENRLLAQGKAELRAHMQRFSSRPYVERIADLHLLLWLSKQPNLDKHDMTLLADAVRTHSPVLEGYRVIIDSIAGL